MRLFPELCLSTHFWKSEAGKRISGQTFLIYSEFTNRLDTDIVNCQILSNLRPFFFLRETEM